MLAALPFLIYGSRGHVHAPHLDHAPRHGGLLFMLGDHHVELVAGEAQVELFVSDASRRPLRPLSGTVSLSSGERVPLAWSRQRLMAELRPGDALLYEIELEDGSELSLPAP